MLALLVESAARSLVLGAVVWLGLRFFRVQNPQVRMTAWTVVLAVSLAMPGLTPWMKVTIPAGDSPLRLERVVWVELPPFILPAPTAPDEFPAAQALPSDAAKATPAPHVSWRFIALGIYIFAGGILLLRLLVGLLLTQRIVRAARPVTAPWAAGTDIRVSRSLAVPVTFASTILLPSGYTAWSQRKLRAVLWHENSHVTHGDFYVLLLAAIHRAVFWFNPFAWWLLAHLNALAEMTSDDAAISRLGDRRGYAGILLDMAKTAQRQLAGLAMARPSMVPWRIERILAEAAAPAPVRPRQRLLTAAILLPFAALSAVTIAQGTAPSLRGLIAPASDILRGARWTDLDRYTGLFEINPTSVLTVKRQGEELIAQLTGQPQLRLTALGGHEFTDASGNVTIAFVLSGDGPASEIRLRERYFGQRHGTRIDAVIAGGIEAAFQRRAATAPDRFRDQTPIPGAEAVLRQTIEDLRLGSPAYEQMSLQLADKLRKQLPSLHKNLELFGPIQSVSFKAVGPGGYDVYDVKFANGFEEARIDMAPGGRLEDVGFRPDGDATQGGIAACASEPTLKSLRDTVPIRLSITNRSGAAIRLFWLSFAGKRVSGATIEDDSSMFVWTSIANPWVIASLSGECREILMPGQLTRYYTAESLQSPALPRTSQMLGSAEVLRLYIDGVRGGSPSYDRMTPEAAAKTRQLLSRRQALLAKLGPLHAMTFQGVSPSGSDVYKVQFANGQAEWHIGFLNDGRIGSVDAGVEL